MLRKIKNLTSLCIFMLFAFNSNVFTQANQSPINDCDLMGCTAVATTFTMSEYVQVKDCMAQVDFQFLKCGMPPNEVYTMNIVDFTLDCAGSPPTNQEIMRAIKEYLLIIAYPLASNGDSYFPDDFEVKIMSPQCFELEYIDGQYVPSATFSAPFKDDCRECCSDSYILDENLYQLQVTDIIRGGSSSTICYPQMTTTCDNVCDENLVPEGVIQTNDYYSCISTGKTSYLFGGTLSNNYNPDRKYMSYVDFRSSGSSYEVSPKWIYGIGGDGVDDADAMKDYVMDLINNRVELLGVGETDNMDLLINQCWSNSDGNAYPCVENCCLFEISFSSNSMSTIMHIDNSSNLNSATCTSPCFDVCETILELDNQEVENYKPIFKVDKSNLDEYLKIIPNPSSGITNIQYKSEINGLVEMYILTLDGQKIAVRQFSKESDIVNYDFNTKTFSNGTYFIKIMVDGQQRLSKKIIIQN